MAAKVIDRVDILNLHWSPSVGLILLVFINNRDNPLEIRYEEGILGIHHGRDVLWQS